MNRIRMRAAAVLLMIGALVVPPGYAQQASQAVPDQARQLTLTPDYSVGQSWFPHFRSPYTPLDVPEPMLTNSPRIDQLIQNGKLMLSLEDAISLGLENNMAIAVERYVPWLDQANLLLAKSGANGKTQFDPTITGTLSLAQTTTPVNNPFFAGTGALSV